MLSELACLKSNPSSEGAFYVLIHLDTNRDDMDMAKLLIDEFGVATIPGSAFGITSGCYLRLSYGALSDNEIKEGMSRLQKGLKILCN